MSSSDEAPRLVEPVQDRSKLSTRRLLEAAGSLIAERGYEGTSLAAIGARAGHSRGLVTARFRTKEVLLDALIDRITSDWARRSVLPRLVDLSGLDALLGYLDSVAHQLETDPGPLAVLWGLSFEAARPSSPLQSRFVAYHDNAVTGIADYIRIGIEDGSVRADVDPSREARLYTAMMRGIAYHWMLHRDDAQARSLFDDFRVRVERDLHP